MTTKTGKNVTNITCSRLYRADVTIEMLDVLTSE